MTSTTNKEEFSVSNGSVPDRGNAQATQPVEGQELPSTFVPFEPKPQLGKSSIPKFFNSRFPLGPSSHNSQQNVSSPLIGPFFYKATRLY